jgi:hypothetical protein
MAGQPDHPYSFTKTGTDKYRVDQRFSGGCDPLVQPGANVVQVGNVRAFEQEQKPRAGQTIEPAHHGNGRSRASTSYVYRTNGINSVYAGLRIDRYEER